MKTGRICRGIESHGLISFEESGFGNRKGKDFSKGFRMRGEEKKERVAETCLSLPSEERHDEGGGRTMEVYGGDGLADMERRETGGEEWHEKVNGEMVAAEEESSTAGKRKRKGKGRKRRSQAVDTSSEELLEGI